MTSWAARNLWVAERLVAYHRTGWDLPVLVLLHGLTDDGLCWSRVAAHLEDRFDIVMLDARGPGRSGRLDGDPFDVPALAADAAGALDALGIGTAFVFGHSMGAITAAALAAERPDLVRALVLEDPPLDLPSVDEDVRRNSMTADLAPWATMDPGEYLDAAVDKHPNWDRLELGPWVGAKLLVDAAVLDHLQLFDAYDWRTTFSRLRTPGILLTGEPSFGGLITDQVAAEAGRLWDGGSVLRISGAGHSIHRDQWQTSMAAVEATLLEMATQSKAATTAG